MTLFSSIVPGLEDFEAVIDELSTQPLSYSARQALAERASAMLGACVERLERGGRIEEVRLEELERRNPAVRASKTSSQSGERAAGGGGEPGAVDTGARDLAHADAAGGSRASGARRACEGLDESTAGSSESEPCRSGASDTPPGGADGASGTQQSDYVSLGGLQAHLCVVWVCLAEAGEPNGVKQVCRHARPSNLAKLVERVPAAKRASFEAYLEELEREEDHTIERACTSLEALIEDRDVDEWLAGVSEFDYAVCVELAEAVAGLVEPAP